MKDTNPEVLVLGAEGVIGYGVVGALLETGQPTLVAGAEGQRMQALRTCFGNQPRLTFLADVNLADEAAAGQLAARIEKRGRLLQAVFACLASPLRAGRLLEQPLDRLRQRLEKDVLERFAAARHLLPLLARCHAARPWLPSHFLLLDGPLPRNGWAGHGHYSVAAAATRMLVEVLKDEAAPLGVRVQLLNTEHPILTPENATSACSEWPSALAVGRRAVALLEREQAPWEWTPEL